VNLLVNSHSVNHVFETRIVLWRIHSVVVAVANLHSFITCTLASFTLTRTFQIFLEIDNQDLILKIWCFLYHWVVFLLLVLIKMIFKNYNFNNFIQFNSKVSTGNFIWRPDITLTYVLNFLDVRICYSSVANKVLTLSLRKGIIVLMETLAIINRQEFELWTRNSRALSPK
jgi:hypothetical protein